MTFIIAEVGSNFHTFEQAKDSVSMAAKLGANAVKFQLADPWALYGDEDGKTSPLREWLPALHEKAVACRIMLMCSVFHPDDVEFVDKYVGAHKIAACESNWPQLVEAVAKTKKQTFVTVGASPWREIQVVVETFAKDQLCLMYSEPEYPSYHHNLFRIDALKQYGCPVGYSDHSRDVIYAPLSAVQHFGVQAIEKHVNLVGVTGTPDEGHSLSADEFQIMVKALRGDEVQGVQCRKEFISTWRRRLKVTKPIRPGDVLQYGVNFAAYRSRTEDLAALAPGAWERVEGKLARQAAEPGDPVSPQLIQG